MSHPKRIHVFCRVVDNYGDIGVCWRLAQQLAAEFSRAPTLWVDDLDSFHRICKAVDCALPVQEINGVTVRSWHDAAFAEVRPEDTGDLVIEAFACDLPASYVTAMASRSQPPVWINLEYLSAESWVEGCHAMPSPHPFLPLVKHFFFPGFSAHTGGLIAESALIERRDAFLSDRAAVAGFFDALGVRCDAAVRKLSLFCYPDAPARMLFDLLQADAAPTACLVPEGVASAAVEHFLGRPPAAGASATRGNLTLHVIPFFDQADYDRLLWACDLNVVRGEDSFVRAQWAGKPFLWHIYPQEDGAHWKKLDAFLARYRAGLDASSAETLATVSHAWNGHGALSGNWHSFMHALPDISRHAVAWATQLQGNGNLAANLIQFAEKFS